MDFRSTAWVVMQTPLATNTDGVAHQGTRFLSLAGEATSSSLKVSVKIGLQD
jgi:hypothetical protein